MSKPFMTLAMSVGIGGCLGLTTASSASAEDLKIAEFDYIRVQASLGAVEAPEVEEDSTDGNGVNTNYEWNGGRESGYQAALTVLIGRAKNGQGGWQWGGELVYGHYNITPSDFTVGGIVYQNDSGSELNHQTIGVNLLGGYQWGLTDVSEFTGFIEVMPHVGGGVALAENEVHDTNSGYLQERGTGYYWELGLRVGAYITEQRFIYGVNVSYTYGGSEVDMDFSGGFSSELELTRSGFGIAGVVGYRF
jgi:hypothetical protein